MVVLGDWVEVWCSGHGGLEERLLGRRRIRREYKEFLGIPNKIEVH